MALNKRVIVTFRQEGFHSWPGATQEVIYLKSPHRHLFHWRVEVSVQDSNREVEFHGLLWRAEALVKTQASKSTTWSCEQKAEQLIKDLEEINYAVLAVECWEDGECGARVEVED